MDIELRHLRCFVAIARKGNVTRAAEQLHITQPALSRTLAQLESRLGIRLLDRSTRHIALTSEGEAFLPKAEHVLMVVEETLDVSALRNRPLRVGHSWSAIGEHTSRVLDAWSKVHPNEPIELRRVDERTAGLLRGLTDVAIVRGTVEEPDLASTLLFSEKRYAAVHVEHVLADRKTVRLEELAKYPIVNNVVSGTTSPELWRLPPNIIGVSNTDDWLMMIAAGRAVGVTPESTRFTYAHPSVTYIPLRNAPKVDVFLSWRHDAEHGAISDFVALAQQLMGRR